MSNNWRVNSRKQWIEYKGETVPLQYIVNSLNSYHKGIEDLEKEVQQLKEEKAKLAEKMLNVIGVVSRVSDDAYRCIHKDFIAELKELDK